MDDSAIICDDGMNADAKSNDEVKSLDETNFNEKKAICKTQNFFILLPFFLITIALLIAVTIYCHLINIVQNKNIYYYFNSQITNSNYK